jgi:hypothetical protein
LFAAVLASFRNRAALQVEILALRHQLGVLHRSVKRPRLTAVDRLFWAWLSELWSDWRTVLVIVQPETVIAWHRKSFRPFWIWKVRNGSPGLTGRDEGGPRSDSKNEPRESDMGRSTDFTASF